MKIIIYTSFPCLLKTESWQETLEENENLTLDNCELITVYPIGKTTRPSFVLDIDKNQSPFYRIVKKEEKILVFLLDGIFAQNIKICSIDCNSQKCQIEIAKNEVSFICSGNKKVLTLPEPILSYDYGNFRHIAYSKLTTDSQQYLIAYNTQTFQSKIFKGDEIEIQDNGFTVLSSPHGYQSTREEYTITQEGLKIADKTFSTLSLPNFEKTLCFRFMNSIKLGDYNTAISMLAPDLASTLSAKTLHQYFGNISYIFPLDESTCFAISNNKNTIFSFNISNNKITEINDNQ